MSDVEHYISVVIILYGRCCMNIYKSLFYSKLVF